MRQDSVTFYNVASISYPADFMKPSILLWSLTREQIFLIVTSGNVLIHGTGSALCHSSVFISHSVGKLDGNVASGSIPDGIQSRYCYASNDVIPSYRVLLKMVQSFENILSDTWIGETNGNVSVDSRYCSVGYREVEIHETNQGTRNYESFNRHNCIISWLTFQYLSTLFQTYSYQLWRSSSES